MRRMLTRRIPRRSGFRAAIAATMFAMIAVPAAVIVAAAPASASVAPPNVIAFVLQHDGGTLTISTLNMTTHARGVLVTGSSPAWSPDGRRLAFISPTNEVVIRNANGSLTHTGVAQMPSCCTTDAYMQWSPDGQHLAYMGTDDLVNEISIWVMNTTVPYNPHRVGPGAFPTWSPDGERIMYQRADGAPFFTQNIHMMDLDGGNDVQITHNVIAEVFFPSL